MDRPPDLDLLAVVSVDDIEREAPRYVAASAWNYFASGAETESTLRANVASFGTYLLVPRMLVPGSSRPDLGVTLPLGRRLASPVLVAPSAMHRLAHPDGELASARAAASRGAGYCLSTLSTTPLEEVAAAAKPGCPLLLLQVYILKDREATAGLVRRAARCGFDGLVLTLDLPVPGRRWPDMRPPGLSLPSGLALANLPVRAFSGGGGPAGSGHGSAGSGLYSFFADQMEPELRWADVGWLREAGGLPVWVKGVLHPQDALASIAAGATGVIVSNHGGRQADGSIASLQALGAVAAAVRGAAAGPAGKTRVPILFDGGIRRGSDVLKALALGADAVLVGRPAVWGLCVAGEAGVEKVLGLLDEELATAMRLCGAPRAEEVPRGLVLGPGETVSSSALANSKL